MRRGEQCSTNASRPSACHRVARSSRPAYAPFVFRDPRGDRAEPPTESTSPADNVWGTRPWPLHIARWPRRTDQSMSASRATRVDCDGEILRASAPHSFPTIAAREIRTRRALSTARASNLTSASRKSFGQADRSTTRRDPGGCSAPLPATLATSGKLSGKNGSPSPRDPAA